MNEKLLESHPHNKTKKLSDYLEKEEDGHFIRLDAVAVVVAAAVVWVLL